MSSPLPLHTHGRQLLQKAYNALKTWGHVNDMIKEQIQQKEYKHLKAQKYDRGWKRIMEGAGDLKSIKYWGELYEALTEILNKYNNQEHSEEIDFTASSDLIRFAITPCHDTAIPAIYIHKYEKDFGPRFKLYPCREWEINISVIGDLYDLIIHNFATVLSYNILNDDKLLYWPYFDFNGYYLFIKKSAVKEFNNKHSFRTLSRNDKRNILENCRILVEKHTDFEWVLKDYCKKYDCDWSLIEDNIVDTNTNEAKKIFLEHEDADIYITNSVHGCELEHIDYLELIAKTDELTDHLNSNGLICTEGYYNNNPKVVDKIIKNWFVDIKNFKKEINQARVAGNQIHVPVMGLTRFLQVKLNSSLKEEDLNSLYAYDEFYDNRESIFQNFYNSTLVNQRNLNNYIGIAKTQLKPKYIETEFTNQSFETEIQLLKAKMLRLSNGK